ncbi:hypothetical protein OESDEN_21766, partial [Oesophagostomum dentatum]
MPNIEGLLKIINEIPEGDEGAPEKVAELARKYKDVFEKKPGEIEHFLSNCNPKVGSAAMMAALKALFDSSIQKNNEQGADRAVEFLKHLIDSGNMVAEHLKLVPDIVFPFARNAVTYCFRKKNEPQIGLDLALAAMRLLVDPNECMVSSLHSALFAVCLRVNNVEAALPYIYRNVTALVNENELRRAISLLESAVLIPGSATSVAQLDALKKYHLASLLYSGKVIMPVGRSSALTRAWKLVGDPYTALATAVQSNGDKASAVEKDGSVGLINRIIKELRERAVMSVAK